MQSRLVLADELGFERLMTSESDREKLNDLRRSDYIPVAETETAAVREDPQLIFQGLFKSTRGETVLWVNDDVIRNVEILDQSSNDIIVFKQRDSRQLRELKPGQRFNLKTETVEDYYETHEAPSLADSSIHKDVVGQKKDLGSTGSVLEGKIHDVMSREEGRVVN